MARLLSADRRLYGDAGLLLRAFRGDPAAWLPELTRPTNRSDHWLTYLWAGQLGAPVELTLGRPRPGNDDTTWRLLRWEPGPSLVRTPGFDGDLGLRREPDGSATLLIQGTYHAPGGVLGGLADRLVLHRVAGRTTRTLLADIAARLKPAAPAVAPPSALRRTFVEPD